MPIAALEKGSGVVVFQLTAEESERPGVHNVEVRGRPQGSLSSVPRV